VAPVKNPFTYQRIKPVVLSFIILAVVFSPPSVDPSHKSVIDALAPFEIVADGFREPMDVVTDEQGVFFVSDRKAGKVFEITDGNVETLVGHLKRPVGLAFDPEGRLLIVEGGRGRLLRLEADESLTVVVDGMNDPRWLAVAEDGTVYISAKGIKEKKDRDRNKDDDDDDDDGGHRDDDDENGDDDDEDEKKKHKSHGEVILRLTTDDQLSVLAYGFKDLEGLAVGTDVLFASAQGHRELRRWDKEDDDENDSRKAGGIFEIPILPDRTAGPITRLTRNRITRPVGLALDRLGALYVTAKRIKVDKKVKHAIGKVAPDSALSRFASGLKNGRGMALDSSGNLHVAVGKGKRRGRIVRFQAPPPPILSVPAFTKESFLTVNGTTEPDSRIDVFVNESNSPATTLLTEDGTFSFSVDLVPNTQNLLTVFTTPQNPGLTSAPAEFFTTHDDVAPAISNIQPVNGSFVNVQDPPIRADFSDNFTGVDISSVEVLLDGFPVTSQAVITATGFTLTPFPLTEGSHTVSVTVADLATNQAFGSTDFSVDLTVPTISNLNPSDGSVVTTATPQIEAQFSDNLAGINVGSVKLLLDGVEVSSQATISASGLSFVPTSPLSQGQHTFLVSVQDNATNLAQAQSTFTVSLGPQLGPIGNKAVDVGSTLSFTVSATDPSGGAITFSVSPLPLRPNMSFNIITGEFAFAPALDQVGSLQLTFAATSAGVSDSETITITVPPPPPAGVTAFTGRILDANDFELGVTTPVVGATVSFLGSGVSANSDANGNFTLSNNVPSGSQVFDIDASTASPGPNGASYGGFREEIDLIGGVNNVVDRPFFLPRIAVNSLTTVNPNFFTTVTNPDLGVSLTVPPNTAKDENGNNFTGELSISLVPRELAPVELPDTLDPGLLVTIQPVGVTFSTPVPITFPNIDNLAPGTETDIWSLDPETGTFVVVGTGLVSSDGTTIETISGGIRSADWHFTAPRAAIANPSGTGRNSQSSGIGGTCQVSTRSSVCAKDGFNLVDHTTASYRSLGVSRSITLNYNSFAAFPVPIIPSESLLSAGTAVPPTFSLGLEVGGVEQGDEIFYQAGSQTLRQAISFDANAFSTGRYTYRLRFKSNYTASAISTFIDDFVLVQNEVQSPIGAGWTLNVRKS